jgi:O-antigen ligase
VLPLLVIITANFLFSNKLLKVTINLLMIILILATFSRMGVVCLIIYYAITFVPKRLFYYVVIPISVLISPILLYQLNQFAKSLLEFNPKSVDHRFQIIEGSIRMIKANPIWGYGYNVKSPIGLESHNTYLQLLMYGGILGFLLVFLPIVFCYIKFYSIPLKDGEGYRIKKLLLGMMFPFLISIFFLSYLTIKFFWIFVMIFFLGKNVLVARNEA